MVTETHVLDAHSPDGAARGRRPGAMATAGLLAATAATVGVTGGGAVDSPAQALGPTDTPRCVMGLLITGAGFVASAMNPPAGVAAWLAWGSFSGGMAFSLEACRSDATWFSALSGLFVGSGGSFIASRCTGYSGIYADDKFSAPYAHYATCSAGGEGGGGGGYGGR